MKTKSLLFSALLTLTASAEVYAVDYGKLAESVDKQKAVESVDQEKAKEALSAKDGVDYEKAYESVDKGKAKDSVDMEKAKSAFGFNPSPTQIIKPPGLVNLRNSQVWWFCVSKTTSRFLWFLCAANKPPASTRKYCATH